MRMRQTFKVILSASLIAEMAGCTAQPAGAQSVHRAKVEIVAGPTVQVSKVVSNMAHYENLAAGDPVHAGRILACSMVDPKEAGKSTNQNCYVSFDSGKNWDSTLKITEGSIDDDPTAVYGLGDDVYVVSLVSRKPDTPVDPDPDAPRHDGDDVVFKSTDGGRTWNETSRIRGADRPFIGIDMTNGKYAGRIYIVGFGQVKAISGSEHAAESLKLWRSLDDGKTFLGPVVAAYPAGAVWGGVGTGAVLSDGTFIVLFGLTKPGRKQSLERELLGDPDQEPNAEMHVIMSRDGGETFTQSHKFADIWRDQQLRPGGNSMGQLAADPGSMAFKDRVYAVFPAIVSDRIQIQFSYSSDKGKTWSKPVIVNDDRSPEQGGKGPDHMLPAIGVNKDGVVLVAWYDRREAKDNLGWRLRAAASLDGGETFSASVPVTDASNAYPPTTPWDIDAGGDSVSISVKVNNFFVSGGHTSGLAVDANGIFHPTWIDNRTGIPQLWSASLKVDGTVIQHGATDLAGLKDISKSVTLELSKPSLDRARGILSVTAQLKNISKDTVEDPVKIRALTLESELGVPEITNADNGQNGTGAVWDFSSQLSGGTLASMKLSAPKTLTFRLSETRPLAQGRDFKNGVLSLDTRVYGNIHKEKSDMDKRVDEGKGDL
jgi:hypothetical protein